MRGDITLDDVPEQDKKPTASMVTFPIYRAAVAVLAEPTREKRANALLALPDKIRSAVEVEARRVFDLWKEGFKNDQ